MNIMNNILVKSINGIVFGTISYTMVSFFMNIYYKKRFSLKYDIFKMEFDNPLFLAGLLGFSFGYIGKPLIYTFLYKSKKY